MVRILATEWKSILDWVHRVGLPRIVSSMIAVDIKYPYTSGVTRHFLCYWILIVWQLNWGLALDMRRGSNRHSYFQSLAGNGLGFQRWEWGRGIGETGRQNTFIILHHTNMLVHYLTYWDGFGLVGLWYGLASKNHFHFIINNKSSLRIGRPPSL